MRTEREPADFNFLSDAEAEHLERGGIRDGKTTPEALAYAKGTTAALDGDWYGSVTRDESNWGPMGVARCDVCGKQSVFIVPSLPVQIGCFSPRCDKMAAGFAISRRFAERGIVEAGSRN